MEKQRDDIHSVDIPVGVFPHFHVLTVAMYEYLDKNYGRQELLDYLRQFARSVYRPLVDKVRAGGLPAMRQHLAEDFDAEAGKYEFRADEGVLEFHVTRCPAVWYLKDHDERLPETFCLQTEIVLGEICRRARIEFSVEFNTSEGRCVQTFRKLQEAKE